MSRRYLIVRLTECPYPIGPWLVVGESTEDPWEWVVISEHDTRRAASIQARTWMDRAHAIESK
jgi:hypothetical protein